MREPVAGDGARIRALVAARCQGLEQRAALVSLAATTLGLVGLFGGLVALLAGLPAAFAAAIAITVSVAMVRWAGATHRRARTWAAVECWQLDEARPTARLVDRSGDAPTLSLSRREWQRLRALPAARALPPRHDAARH